MASPSQGPNPTDEVNRALKDPRLDTVDSSSDKPRAHDVAATVGTSGRVLSEVTIRGINDKTAGNLDTDIKSGLKKMIDNDAMLRDRDIASTSSTVS